MGHSVTYFSKDWIGHELVIEVCLLVTFSCLWSRTLYKEKLLQYLDIVGVVFFKSYFDLSFSDPAGVLYPTVYLTFSTSYKNIFANSTYFAADRFLLVAAVYVTKIRYYKLIEKIIYFFDKRIYHDTHNRI